MDTFCFIDKVQHISEGSDSITASFTLSPEAEFLQDHFEGFAVMPGVLMLESARQACERLLYHQGRAGSWRLYQAENIRYGQFVRPLQTIEIQARHLGVSEDDTQAFDVCLVRQAPLSGRALSGLIKLKQG